MIIVTLQGGFGNQLFQYAAAKALAVKHNCALKIDPGTLATDTQRRLELSNLPTNFSIATAEEIDRLKPSNTFGRIIEKFKPSSIRHFYKEPHFHFDKAFHLLPQPVYLQGYFQSEKYFAPVANIIRQEYRMDKNLLQPVLSLASEIKNQNAVAIHIRKGDYQNKTHSNYHGLLPATYYKQAIAFLKSKLENPTFYVFSDDPLAVMKELDLSDGILVSGNITHNHLEDLYLMTQCSHNIIANSSFSWWGAWLNKNPGKIVVAPSQWFNNGPQDTQDLLPTDWVKL